MKKISFLLTLLCVSLVSFSQILKPVKWTFSSKKISDCEYEFQFKATIDKGWHLYSVVPVEDGPIATSFTFTKTKDYELAGKIQEGKTIKKYEAVFSAELSF